MTKWFSWFLLLKCFAHMYSYTGCFLAECHIFFVRATQVSVMLMGKFESCFMILPYDLHVIIWSVFFSTVMTRPKVNLPHILLLPTSFEVRRQEKQTTKNTVEPEAFESAMDLHTEQQLSQLFWKVDGSWLCVIFILDFCLFHLSKGAWCQSPSCT